MPDLKTSSGFWVSVAQIAAWFVASLAAVFDALYINEAVVWILQALQMVNYNKIHEQGGTGINYQFGFAITAASNFLYVVLGCAVVGFSIWAEYYFRKGRAVGLLWKRIGVVLAGQAAVIVAIELLRLILKPI